METKNHDVAAGHQVGGPGGVDDDDTGLQISKFQLSSVRTATKADSAYLLLLRRERGFLELPRPHRLYTVCPRMWIFVPPFGVFHRREPTLIIRDQYKLNLCNKTVSLTF